MITPFIDRTYAVPYTFLFACGSMVRAIYLYFVFALAERKNEIQMEDKVPLRKSTSEPPRKSYH